ncbi:hypothetical protein [Chitinophaga pinensis]|uniref:hypothetical protein n=1 Tax=Chitinophaga pinensis TaxID=79329 RepID=UPI001647CF11|nr:hypothetical protein [Chitinophaga pinensis]
MSGYVAKQRIANEDKRIALPAYGYLHYQRANGNEGLYWIITGRKKSPTGKTRST